MVSSDRVDDVPHDGAGWRLLVHVGDHELGGITRCPIRSSGETSSRLLLGLMGG